MDTYEELEAKAKLHLEMFEAQLVASRKQWQRDCEEIRIKYQPRFNRISFLYGVTFGVGLLILVCLLLKHFT